MSEIEIEILRRTVADLTQRVQTLEMALNPGVASCCDVTGEPCACGERRCDPAPVQCRSRHDEKVTWQCNLTAGHDGNHGVYSLESGALLMDWPDPAPTPEWRRLVEREVGYYALPVQARGAAYRKAPLPDVLHLLSVIAEIGGDCRTPLARIVAVCEAQIGNGWKAVPGPVPPGLRHTRFLLSAFGDDWREAASWQVLANRAAAWLKALTEDAS